MNITFEKSADGTAFFCNGVPAAYIDTLPGTEDSFTISGDAVCWTRICRTPADHMRMEVKAAFAAEHQMIPAISYDGNPWGHDHEYKGFEENSIPYTFASHRTALPGASVTSGEGFSLALFGENDASGSLYIRSGHGVHALIWPETEEPRCLAADGWQEAWHSSMTPRSTFQGWLFFGTSEECDKYTAIPTAAVKMLRFAWEKNQTMLIPHRDSQEIWDFSIDYAKRLFTEEPNGFCGFSIGFQRNGSGWCKRPEDRYEIGWCGQNASLAVSLLYHYELTGDETARDMALKVLDSWCSIARSSSGFLLTRYDPDDRDKYLIDACNLGTAGVQLYEAGIKARELGIKRPAWLCAACEICDFAVKRQNSDGSFSMSWNPDGTVHTKEGTAGAFLILPLARIGHETSRQNYIDSAVSAFRFYYEEFRSRGYGTSGALDTCCIDKESVIPLFKGALLLYKSLKNPSYLRMAQEAAWYLSTWQWHQSVKYPADTLLGSIGYDTFGGTAVSTSHLHLDPYALSYMKELQELAELTDDSQWNSRALAIWCNTSQGISDGTTIIGSSGVRPKGSCDEGILHTRWGSVWDNKWESSFSVTQWLVAWPCAFRLEVLRDVIHLI